MGNIFYTFYIIERGSPYICATRMVSGQTVETFSTDSDFVEKISTKSKTTTLFVENNYRIYPFKCWAENCIEDLCLDVIRELSLQSN